MVVRIKSDASTAATPPTSRRGHRRHEGGRRRAPTVWKDYAETSEQLQAPVQVDVGGAADTRQ
jgi:hypothetical protein